MGFLPTFINLEALTYLDTFVVVLVVSMVLGSVMLGYAYMADRGRVLLQGTKAQRKVNQISAGVMASVGLALIVKT